MNHQIVSRHPLWDATWFRVAVAGAIILAGYLLFQLGLYRAGPHRASLENEIASQRQDYGQLKLSNQDLREQLALLERGRDVEEVAYKQLQEELTVLQDQLLELKEEVAFYRGIVSKEDSSQGLAIQSFNLAAAEEANAYRFKLVLTQILKDVSVANGQVHIVVEGLADGEMRALSYTDIAEPDSDRELRYRFQYFQNLDGALRLPEGFAPTRVIVKLVPRGSKRSQLEQAFDWIVKES